MLARGLTRRSFPVRGSQSDAPGRTLPVGRSLSDDEVQLARRAALKADARAD
ncbi:hypothetical protein BH09ACT2_BH09ACT2_03440 [soil metagenome]